MNSRSVPLSPMMHRALMMHPHSKRTPGDLQNIRHTLDLLDGTAPPRGV
jgi:hypothetical protein